MTDLEVDDGGYEKPGMNDNMTLAKWRVEMGRWGDDDLPIHCQMPVTIDGNGPTQSNGELTSEFHHWACWCPDGASCSVLFNGTWSAMRDAIDIVDKAKAGHTPPPPYTEKS